MTHKEAILKVLKEASPRSLCWRELAVSLPDQLLSSVRSQLTLLHREGSVLAEGKPGTQDRKYTYIEKAVTEGPCMLQEIWTATGANLNDRKSISFVALTDS